MSAFWVCVLVACGDPVGPRAVSRGITLDPEAGAEAHTNTKFSAPRPLQRHRRGAPPSNRVLLKAPPPAAPIVVVEREERPSDEVLVARDYAAELRAMLGDPSDCLTAIDRAIGRNIAFQVEVDVQSTGRVVDARVSSPNISPAALACVTGIAQQVRFGAFTDGTRHVQTPLVLHLRAP